MADFLCNYKSCLRLYKQIDVMGFNRLDVLKTFHMIPKNGVEQT